MQGPIRCVVIAGILIGCSGDDTTVPPPDATEGGTGGLVVQWSSAPETWPGDLGNGATLERAEFAFDNLRVVGDGGPGDPRTTATAFKVRWDENTTPVALMFVDAPAGLYSQVSMAIDGHLTTDTFDIRGHVNLSGTDYEYRIDGDNPLAVTVGIDKTLTPPDTATVKLRINFTHALDSVDFATLDIDSGKIELSDGDSQMDAFRAALVESFEITDAGSSGAGLR
jgi:hypothetical protein